MNTEKKSRIREIVRNLMKDKVDSLVENDIFMDDEIRERVFGELDSDLIDDVEILDSIDTGKNGNINKQVYEQFIDTLTDSFMNRFKNL